MIRTFDRKRDKINGFRILYQSVLQEFKGTKKEYGLQEQWLEYVLFLMIPRADELYEGMGELDYLFPFPKVKKNSKIVLYGMGLYGNRLYNFLNDTGFCQVVAVADRNYNTLQKKGLAVISPEDIKEYSFDAIVITLSFADVVEAVKEYLSSIFPKEKIHTIDQKIMKNQSTLKAFGLLEGDI